MLATAAQGSIAAGTPAEVQALRLQVAWGDHSDFHPAAEARCDEVVQSSDACLLTVKGVLRDGNVRHVCRCQ